jgi:hypothetical protein
MRCSLAACLACLVALSANQAHGFCVTKPTLPDGTQLPRVRWPAGVAIKYRIHDTGSGQVTPREAEFQAVKDAFTEWENAPCSDIRFEFAGFIPAGDAVELSYDEYEIRVYWAVTEDQFGGAPSAQIARSHYGFSVDGAIRTAAIQLNAFTKTWGVGGELNRYDVQSVMAVQVGRALGLAQSHDADAVMAASYEEGKTSYRTLQADDLAGAAFLYPETGDGGADGDGGSCAVPVEDSTCQAGQPEPPSQGDPPDIEPPANDGGTVDSGVDGTDPSECGCRAAATGDAAPWGLLLLWALLLRLRGRGRGKRQFQVAK